MHPRDTANLTQIGEFDEVIDARSPAEYAEDHLPGAISCPVLDDEQRARVGTLYKQQSPFVARKLGGVLVARNIADHIERLFQDKPRDWRPLVYCWRGGQRSGAFTHILRQVGWDARQLEGGYKAWRRHVLVELAILPARFSWRVVSGSTGSGKSRLLEALAAEGAQVLHLEQMAAHKGSVLGRLPGQPQPSQKAFESMIFQVLSGFDPQRPVFVESESRRIGQLEVPAAVYAALRNATEVQVEASLAARVDFLLRDYHYFVENPEALVERLQYLKGLQSKETIAGWQAMARAGDWETLVRELLEQHYDPLYRRSLAQRPDAGRQCVSLYCADLAAEGLARSAQELIGRVGR